MKKLLVALLFTFLVCPGVEAKQRAYMIFDARPITAQTVVNTRPVFRAGQKIHYAILCEKGFRDSVLKVQVIQKDEKSEFFGYTPFMNREVEVSNPKFYIDYFVIHSKGYYIVQVFELKDLQKPIGYGEFWVEEK